MGVPGDEQAQAAGLLYVVRRPSGLPPPWPLLLFLHGAGERGDADGADLWRVRVHGPWKGPGAECFLVVAPQCPTGLVWPALAKEVVELVLTVAKKFPVDRARICATGLSLGAFGVWAAAIESPRLFSAMVPICGGFSEPLPRDTNLTAVLARARLAVDIDALSTVRHLPTWLFHGDRDKIVDVNGSRATFDALGGERRGNSALRFTIFEGAGHSCWGTAYRNPELFKWLLQQRLAGEAPPRTSTGARGGGAPLPEVAARLLGLSAAVTLVDSEEDEPCDGDSPVEGELPLGNVLHVLEGRELDEADEDQDELEEEQVESMRRAARSAQALIRREHPAAKSAYATLAAAQPPLPAAAACSEGSAPQRGEKRKAG